MTVKVEHLDDHSARLSVIVLPDALDRAMKKAAAKISNKVNIPGFRKGKAPYSLILKYVGSQAVLEEAIEDLSQAMYRDALRESGIKAYTPGELEAVDTEHEPEPGLHEGEAPAVPGAEGEAQPTAESHAEGEAHSDSAPGAEGSPHDDHAGHTHNMILRFRVAKQPEVDLNAYRDVRITYEAPVVEDVQVDNYFKSMRESRAVIEPAARPIQFGDKVKFQARGESIKAVEKPSEAVEGEPSSELPPEEPSEEGSATVEEFIDNEFDDVITEDSTEDLVPGFSAHLVGMSADEEKDFSIDLPADFREKQFAGSRVDFHVKIIEVRSRTLPELNDDFARTVSDGMQETLLDYRIDVRRRLQEATNRRYDGEFAEKALDAMVEGAAIRYHDIMVEENIDDVLQSLDQNFRNSGLTLEYFKKIQNKSDQDLRNDYRETATRRLRRSLVLGKIADVEQVTIPDNAVKERIDEMAETFGDQREQFVKMLMRPESQAGIAMDILTEAAQKRIIAIAKGENPPLPGSTPAEQTSTEQASAEQ